MEMVFMFECKIRFWRTILLAHQLWAIGCGIAETLENKANALQPRSFVIDIENDRFLKDGQPFRYLSGSVHYFRVPAEYWTDRLLKLRAAGLNAVETIAPWNIHEPFPGKYDFAGNYNLPKFLEIAQELGLLVILRPGPFTCGGVDGGGLPWWLYKIKGLKARTSESQYLAQARKWFEYFMSILRPFLYKNGGPIISVQVENEYGYVPAYVCDNAYLEFIRDLLHELLGKDVVLFTVDNWLANLTCGTVEGVYPTVDFGPWDDTAAAFAVQRRYAPKGPLVNTEFYPGWISIWGFDFRRGDVDKMIAKFGEIYRLNASVNFFMFEGKTAGYRLAPYTSFLQTYDGDAPLTEGGVMTEKFFAIRAAVEALSGQKNSFDIPPQSTVKAYDSVLMKREGSILDFLIFCKYVEAEFPLTFEQLDFPYGFVLYEITIVSEVRMKTLSVGKAADRGYVMIDERLEGLLDRDNRTSLDVTARAGQKLRILVENRGRFLLGYIEDPKGILGNVTLDGNVLTDWRMYLIDLEALSTVLIPALNAARHLHGDFVNWHRRKREIADIDNSLRIAQQDARVSNGLFLPGIYSGILEIKDAPADTHFDSTGWGHGQLLVNGRNLGKYWPLLGPQITVWIPGPWLRRGHNSLVLLELEQVPVGCETHAGNCLMMFANASKL